MAHTRRLQLRRLTVIALAGLVFAPARTIAQSAEMRAPGAPSSPIAGTRDARAQPSIGVVPGSGLKVRIGQTVWVTTVDGLRRRGTVAGITRDAIELSSNGQSTIFPATKVTRIQVWDSPIEGLVGGAVAGAVFGYLIAGPGCLDDDKCSGLMGSLAFGALFAGVGAGIDAVTFRRVIYDTPGGGKATFTLSPLAARQGLGARAALDWRRAR